MTLANRVAVVTGATGGLGLAIARSFLAEGACVAICGRDPLALTAARKQLAHASDGEHRLISMPCDVSSEIEIQGLIAHTARSYGRIDILVNNAGVLGPMGRTETISVVEWRRTIDINLTGVLLASQAVIPHMRSQRYGKIINVSGGGATAARPYFSAYAVSKAAVVRFTENLAAELSDTGIDVNAVAPGALNTRLLDQALEAGPEQIGESQFESALRQKQSGGASLERAAELCVYLSSAASDGITGRLISAVWDPWPTLHERIHEMQDSDVYTLRRIVPEDRAKQ